MKNKYQKTCSKECYECSSSGERKCPKCDTAMTHPGGVPDARWECPACEKAEAIPAWALTGYRMCHEFTCYSQSPSDTAVKVQISDPSVHVVVSKAKVNRAIEYMERLRKSHDGASEFFVANEMLKTIGIARQALEEKQ